MSQCTESCRARVECARCKRTKAPRGRSIPLPMAGSLCDWECPGYREPPAAPHMWPNESLDGDVAELFANAIADAIAKEDDRG